MNSVKSPTLGSCNENSAQSVSVASFVRSDIALHCGSWCNNADMSGRPDQLRGTYRMHCLATALRQWPIEQGYPFFVQEIDDTLLAESFLGFIGKMVFVIEE